MNKRHVTILLSALCLVPALAQSWDEVECDTKTYLSGDGWGATVEEADQQALAALISKISVVVSNDFSITEDERVVNGKIDASSYTNSKLQTYASATLTNTERIVIDNDPDQAHIGRYLKRTELNRIFEGRIRTLNEYIRLGMVAEGACKIDDALRNYYWAFSLLKSVQRPAEVTCQLEETGETIMPLTWLPQRLNDILKGIDAEVTANDGTNVDLMFRYKGQPVSTLDFTYFDGRNWSNICSAKNGRGTMEFTPGMIPDNVQINYEYAYRGQAHINQEIKSVLSVVKGQSLRAARTNIRTAVGANQQSLAQAGTASLTKSGTNSAAKTSATSTTSTAALVKAKTPAKTQAFSSDSILVVKDCKAYSDTLVKVLAAIRQRSYDAVRTCFTDDGWDMFTRLVNYGKARILCTDSCTFSQMRDEVIARSIQMSFSFARGLRKQFVEDVVFTFDADRRIDCIAFGLDRKAKDDIMQRGAWTPLARQTLMQFLENYKTAYSLKRLEYLKTIFDDDAVIIVGHVAEKLVAVNNGQDAAPTYRTQRVVNRTQYNKDQYMKHLEACFGSNEFVNIRFANNDVRRTKDGEEYGIQIKQDYYSTNYGDQGYLYLQVDLEDPDRPVIKVRTWQPEPDPEIGLFGLGNW